MAPYPWRLRGVGLAISLFLGGGAVGIVGTSLVLRDWALDSLWIRSFARWLNKHGYGELASCWAKVSVGLPYWGLAVAVGLIAGGLLKRRWVYAAFLSGMGFVLLPYAWLRTPQVHKHYGWLLMPLTFKVVLMTIAGMLVTLGMLLFAARLGASLVARLHRRVGRDPEV